MLSLDDSGTGPSAKIKDANGASKLFAGNLIMPASAVISPADVEFLAPEVLSRLPFDTKADVWSLGITASLLLDPLKKPYTHIASDPKYTLTEYTTSHNPDYHPRPYPEAIGRGILRGDITPFPNTTPIAGTGNTSNPNAGDCGMHEPQQAYLNLGKQIRTMCLEPNPKVRPSIDAILRIRDYILTTDDLGE
ncbi:hypothetical protein Pelo_7577 [Pelomyxa schiedti]|nr:hypothetical protein Pelo_7577 [Pelomyxa schiedti]